MSRVVYLTTLPLTISLNSEEDSKIVHLKAFGIPVGLYLLELHSRWCQDRTRKVVLKQLGPKQVDPPCLAASASYKEPASTTSRISLVQSSNHSAI